MASKPKRYVLDGAVYESASVDRRTSLNRVDREGIKDWIVPLANPVEAGLAERLVRDARLLRERLHVIEQALCDLNVENFVYITGVHKR